MNPRNLGIKYISTADEVLNSFHTYSTIVSALKSCNQSQNPTIIRSLHTRVLKFGFISDVYIANQLLNAYFAVSFSDACHLFDEMPVRNIVTWNTMITRCSRLGKIEKARVLFDKMPERNYISWNTMIAGHVNVGSWRKGLMLFREMLVNEEHIPDEYTMCSTITGCSRMGSIGLLLGKSLNGFMVKNGWELNVHLGTSLIDMYAKCGNLKYACSVFSMMQDKEVDSWNALICGAAQNGHGKYAKYLFQKMIETDVQPNVLTFTGILSACAQAGLVEDGRNYFKMISDYGLMPRIQHYCCMVDLFGKAGKLEDAFETTQTMPIEPNACVWSSFLTSCKVHKQFEMAERVVDRILERVSPKNDEGVHNLICDLYTMNGKWNDAERVRRLMKEKKVKKQKGSSFITSGRH